MNNYNFFVLFSSIKVSRDQGLNLIFINFNNNKIFSFSDIYSYLYSFVKTFFFSDRMKGENNLTIRCISSEV